MAPKVNLSSEIRESLTRLSRATEGSTFFQFVYTLLETRSSAKIKTADNGNRRILRRDQSAREGRDYNRVGARMMKGFEQEVTEATEAGTRSSSAT